MVAGPSCKPHSKLGKMRGMADPRSDTFPRAIDGAVELDSRNCLKLQIYEITPGILQRLGGNPPYVDMISAYFETKLPHWMPLSVVRLTPTTFGLPQSRMRVFLYSVPKALDTIVPFSDVVAEIFEKSSPNQVRLYNGQCVRVIIPVLLIDVRKPNFISITISKQYFNSQIYIESGSVSSQSHLNHEQLLYFSFP